MLIYSAKKSFLRALISTIFCNVLCNNYLHAQQIDNESTNDRRIVSNACLILKKPNGMSKSAFHELTVPRSDFPARLECYIGEIVCRKDRGAKVITILEIRVLVIEGEIEKLRAFHDWINKCGSTSSVDGFNSTFKLLSEVLKDQPHSFKVRGDYSGQSRREMNFDAFLTEAMPRIFAKPDYSILPVANPSVADGLSIIEAIRHKIGDDLVKSKISPKIE